MSMETLSSPESLTVIQPIFQVISYTEIAILRATWLSFEHMCAFAHSYICMEVNKGASGLYSEYYIPLNMLIDLFSDL